HKPRVPRSIRGTATTFQLVTGGLHRTPSPVVLGLCYFLAAVDPAPPLPHANSPATLLKNEPRGAIDVDVNCDGHVLQLIATHLGLGPAERRQQVQRVLKGFETKDCVLMGDMNEWLLWGRSLLWIQAMFGHAQHLSTFPARWPIFALDRIWVRPPHSVMQLTVHKSVLARQASDHLPLKAVSSCKGRRQSLYENRRKACRDEAGNS
ncbi:MAG: endonuclease/exonuclease/phosphatase family protein, partial [Nitrospiraceae bacterium]